VEVIPLADRVALLGRKEEPFQPREEFVAAGDYVRGLDDRWQGRLAKESRQRVPIRLVQGRDLVEKRAEILRILTQGRLKRLNVTRVDSVFLLAI
jgi:hypothetical protein